MPIPDLRAPSWLFVCALLWSLPCPAAESSAIGPASAELTQPKFTSDIATREDIAARITTLEKDDQTAQATRDKVLELYRLALSRLEAAQRFEQASLGPNRRAKTLRRPRQGGACCGP